MALVYSLAPGAPTGLTIDPTTGHISETGSLPEGVFPVTVLVTDTDTGQTEVCQTLTVSCSPDPDTGEDCIDIIEDTLSEIFETVASQDKQLIQECIADALLNYNPPEPKKDCCADDRIRISVCGRVFDLVDWNGDGVRELNVTPQFFEYITDDPADSDATIAPTLNASSQWDGTLPLLKFAGPPGPNHGLEHITHISDGKTWIPLCCGNGNGTGSGNTEKCILFRQEQLSFPIVFDTDTSFWLVAGEQVDLGECQPRLVNGCVSSAQSDVNGSYTSASIPVIDPNSFDSAPSAGCSTGLTGNSNVLPTAYVLDMDTWVSNGGTATPGNTQTLAATFLASGTPVNMSVGVYDPMNGIWQPVSNATGGTLSQFGNYVNVQQAGSYTINFTIDAASRFEDNLQLVFWGVDDTENISNIGLDAVSTAEEPCGVISSAEELASLMTSRDPYGNNWFVDTDGNICALTPAGLCLLYSPPSFTASSTIECCLVSGQQFPITYNPLTDGLFFNGTLILYGGSGSFATPEDLAAWLNANDPNGYIWVVSLDDLGQPQICGQVRPADKSDYEILTFDGSGELICVAQDVTFPLSYTNDDGWLVNGSFVNFPGGTGSFTTPGELELWLNNSDQLPVNIVDWQALPGANANTWSFCATIPEDFVDEYGDLLFGQAFCCQIESQEFPLQYDSEQDGWIVQNQLIDFPAGIQWQSAQDLADWMNSNDPLVSTWTVYTAQTGQSICAVVDPGVCAEYGGFVLSEPGLRYCDFEGIAFPYAYAPFKTGWGFSDGSFVIYPDDGQFATPQEFADWLSDNDPLNHEWTASLNGDGVTWDFCAFIDPSSQGYYEGETLPNVECQSINGTSISFPYTWDNGAGWRILGDTITFYETVGPSGTFATPQDMADWMTDNDPNDFEWFVDSTAADGDPIFCAVMPPEFDSQYESIYLGELDCALGSDVNFPLNYNTATGGWTIDGIFYPFESSPSGPTGTWATKVALVAWLNQTDPYGNLWEIFPDDRVCTHRPNTSYGGTNYPLVSL
jgi:hypothetical protein